MLFHTPPTTQAAHSSLVYMLETVRRKIAALESLFMGEVDESGGWKLDLERIRVELVNALKGPPVLLLGTAFSFVHLLDYLAQSKVRFQLPAGSKVMETGGYKGRSRVLAKAE